MADLQQRCQNCLLPLHVDGSLLGLSPQQAAALINVLPSTEGSNEEPSIPPDRLEMLNQIRPASEVTLANPMESYVFLGEQEESDQDDQDGNTMASRINSLERLFSILSAKTSVDHPLCKDCCTIIMEKLKREHERALVERETYSQFLQGLTRRENDPEIRKQTQWGHQQQLELQALYEDQKKLAQKLENLETEDEKLDLEIVKLQHELDRCRQLQRAQQAKRNLKDKESLNLMRDLTSLRLQHENALSALDALRKINIYNETFKISHDGPFGTINGMRIGGGVRQTSVTWQEINAGIGHLILLLATINSRLNIHLPRFRLKPMGSYSKVSQINATTGEWEVYEAFHSESFHLRKLFHKETQFDKALECILAILTEMANVLPTQEREVEELLELPYVMNSDRINGMPIKLYGSEPTIEWTTAMKFVLTNAKWILAYVSSHLNNSSN